MTRTFRPDPVAPAVLDRVLDAGYRAPSAGFSQGTDFLVLVEAAARSRYWDLTFPAETRDAYPWPGLFRAPVVILPLCDEAAYRARYREADKVASGLGADDAPWPVPYWLTDAAMAVENILLAAAAEGLGALFFGIFHGERDVLEAFGVAAGRKPVGAIALGHPDADRPSRSLGRGRRPFDEVVHRDRW